MKVIKLIPNGFCFGVSNAYNKALKISNANQNVNIYMLGWLVHNENVINDLKENKIICLDDLNINRYDIIKNLKYQKGDILLLSAHGTDEKTIALAKEKKFEVFDLTCKFVVVIHQIIKEKIKDGFNILFIGKKGHPESNAVLSIDDKIILLENVDDVKKINKNIKYFCTNQTTISLDFLKKINDELIKNNISFDIRNDICNSTKLRQNAIINMDSNIDICIVIGDKRSSNTIELYNIAKKQVDSYLVSNIKDIDLKWLINKKYVALTSGASSPNMIVDEVYNYLLEINND